MRATDVHLHTTYRNFDLMRVRVALMVAAHLEEFWFQGLYQFAHDTNGKR